MKDVEHNKVGFIKNTVVLLWYNVIDKIPSYILNVSLRSFPFFFLSESQVSKEQRIKSYIILLE